jgi:hypothetical protein
MLFAPVLILLVLPVLIDTLSKRSPMHSEGAR